MISRRMFVFGSSALLASCTSQPKPQLSAAMPVVDPLHADLYTDIVTEPFPLPAVDTTAIDSRFLRRIVPYVTREQPGTVVVNTATRFAYLTLGGSHAIRYGVGVGKQEAFNFQGTAIVGRKAEWPRWRPTRDMIRREPDRYAKYENGMDGGPENPLGPRALYLYRDGQDTLYRLHGTTEPWSIGSMVSSGCVRFLNQDIIDLYKRVPVGAKVVVLAAAGQSPDDLSAS
jgi:lipoprotein-anchoring transpeptidase ErfK/SrfK